MSYSILNISSSGSAVDLEEVRIPYGESRTIESITPSVIQLLRDNLISIDLTDPEASAGSSNAIMLIPEQKVFTFD